MKNLMKVIVSKEVDDELVQSMRQEMDEHDDVVTEDLSAEDQKNAKGFVVKLKEDLGGFQIGTDDVEDNNQPSNMSDDDFNRWRGVLNADDEQKMEEGTDGK